MRLVVFVPFESSVHSVEESWFSGPELVFPAVGTGVVQALFQIEELFVLIQMFGRFVLVKTFCCEIGHGRRSSVLDEIGRPLSSRQEV